MKINKNRIHTSYINMHTKETEFECIKCKKMVPKDKVKQLLEDWNDEAIYLKACEECYSDYWALQEFIEESGLGTCY